MRVRLKSGKGSAGKFIMVHKRYLPGEEFDIPKEQFVPYLMDEVKVDSADRPVIKAVKKNMAKEPLEEQK